MKSNVTCYKEYKKTDSKLIKNRAVDRPTEHSCHPLFDAFKKKKCIYFTLTIIGYNSAQSPLNFCYTS